MRACARDGDSGLSVHSAIVADGRAPREFLNNCVRFKKKTFHVSDRKNIFLNSFKTVCYLKLIHTIRTSQEKRFPLFSKFHAREKHFPLFRNQGFTFSFLDEKIISDFPSRKPTKLVGVLKSSTAIPIRFTAPLTASWPAASPPHGDQ